ncbi:MAG: MoxR family ATPase [bacterium]
MEIKEINEKVQQESVFLSTLYAEIGKVIVGQKYFIDRLLIALLGDGHILVEGVPGLAKTLSVSTLCDCIQTKFQRIQFTPDLLPADLIGTLVYNPRETSFSVKKGPIFSNLVLADEINRAPAKVQSALLESMQERQVTISEETYKLEQPFMVLATQNPIEQEGTYPLPEAQVDRFMLKVKIGYPTKEEELEIIERMTSKEKPKANKVIGVKEIFHAREVMQEIYVDKKVKEYIVNLIFATREPDKYGAKDLKGLIAYGASPRASIYLTIASKANAFLHGRGYITPEDVKAVGYDVLRHRIIFTYEAEAENITTDDIVKRLFEEVEVP